MAASDYVSVVQQLYVAYFGRPADTKGLTDFCAALDAAKVPATLAGVEAAYRTNAAVKSTVDSFGTSTESTNLYGTGDNASFVFAIYQNVLGRTPDTNGYKFWVDAMNAGAVTKANVSLSIMAAAMVNTSTQGQADAALITKKIAIAANFTTAITTENATYSGDAAAAAAREMLKLVTSATVVADFQAKVVETLKAITSGPVGQTFTLTTSATADNLIGTAASDKFVGDATTYSDTDRVIDASVSDKDQYNLTINANATPDVTNVEHINITTAATGAVTVNASKISGAAVLKVTPGDVVVGGSTIVGNKTVTVTALNASKVAGVEAGAGTTNLSVTQQDKAGATIYGDTATGNVTVVGAAYVKAAGAGANDTVTVTAFTDAEAGGTAALAAVENAKAVTVKTGAQTVSIANAAGGNAFTGKVEVVAEAATSLTVAAASGGADVTAGVTSTADSTITISAIDDSGATILTGTGSKKAADKNIQIELNGSATGTTTNDKASVAGAGYITLDINNGQAVDYVTLSGTTAGVEFAIEDGDVATAYTLTGDKDVTISGSQASFDGVTITDSTTAGTTTVKLTTLGGNVDLSKSTADKFLVAATGTNRTVTVATGATVQLAADQTTGFGVAGKATGASVTVQTQDDTEASGATIDIAVGAFNAATNLTTVNIEANVGKFTATGTTLAATGTLNITGSKAVALGTVTDGKVINASSSTGAISLNTGTANNTLKTITTGTGNDNVTTATDVVYAVDLGNGDNTLAISANGAADGSSFATGTGADTVTIADASAIVVVTGAGDDTVTIGSAVATDAILVLGEGSGDKLVFTDGVDLSSKVNFAVTGVETIDVTGSNGTAVKIRASAFAQDNAFKLVGNSATADILHVVNHSTTAGATIDASGVTFNATQDAVLYLQGAAKLVDTITGSAKNDVIVASSGADVVNGGDGVDTFNAAALAAADIEGTGTGTSQGVVINLGATAVTNTAVLAATGSFTANSVTSIEAGKTAYLFGAAASTNSAVQQTLSSIENVVGTAGRDYIVGSANDNVITGGAGADYINLGVGNDTVVYATGDASVGTATLATASTLAANDTIVGAEVVAGISAGDKLDLGHATSAAAAGLLLGQNEYIIAQGTYDATSGKFTVGAGGNTGADSILYWDTDAATAGVQAGYVVLLGVVTAEEGTATAGVITFA